MMRAAVQNIRWGTAFPVLAFLGAMAVAIVGAFITGSEFGAVTGRVESVSAQSGNLLGDLGDLFPFGFAFSAGMVSSVNPCGFAMLPAYLGLYLSENETMEAGQSSVLARLLRAVLVGATVSLGFVILFAAVGTPIGLGARGIADAFPWIGLLIGVMLVVAGAYLLSGGKLYNNFAASISARFGNANSKSVRSYFTFGLAYGTASLSCTLPIFLAVIGGTFTAETFLDSVLQFILYGLGMGSVILALTIGMALFKGAIAGGLRRALPHVGTISAVMLLIAGTFIVYYWLTIGELLERIRGA
ncbi:MAG: cytochrome c biogenesis protein CcdA [Chloroflexota bacterium]|nr:cytochrome c biogenesis protein CcdA [Chloroflexota bacterium]MDE2884421.1 cytochrome c biogenesis protein CcdA [Chloroflexota bacterium]